MPSWSVLYLYNNIHQRTVAILLFRFSLFPQTLYFDVGDYLLCVHIVTRGRQSHIFTSCTESSETLLPPRFLLGSYSDNRARRCELRRRPAPAAEPVVQHQARRACKRGPQHTVGATGYSKTGQLLMLPSLHNT